MISSGIVISIAGGVEEIVWAYLLVAFSLFLFFCNHAFIVLGTKSLIQRELWREQNL